MAPDWTTGDWKSELVNQGRAHRDQSAHALVPRQQRNFLAVPLLLRPNATSPPLWHAQPKQAQLRHYFSSGSGFTAFDREKPSITNLGITLAIFASTSNPLH